MYPEDKNKVLWDLAVSLTLLVMSVYTPLHVSFANVDDGFTFGTTLNIIMDLIFGIDIIVVFFSAYYNEDFKIIEDRKRIAIEYLKGWFLLDLVAIIPFDIIFN